MAYIDNKSLGKQGNKGDTSLQIVNMFTRMVIGSGIIKQARKKKVREEKVSKKQRRDRALHKANRKLKMIEEYKEGKYDDAQMNRYFPA